MHDATLALARQRGVEGHQVEVRRSRASWLLGRNKRYRVIQHAHVPEFDRARRVRRAGEQRAVAQKLQAGD
jgi:hypothetical protein